MGKKYWKQRTKWINQTRIGTCEVLRAGLNRGWKCCEEGRDLQCTNRGQGTAKRPGPWPAKCCPWLEKGWKWVVGWKSDRKCMAEDWGRWAEPTATFCQRLRISSPKIILMEKEVWNHKINLEKRLINEGRGEHWQNQGFVPDWITAAIATISQRSWSLSTVHKNAPLRDDFDN